MIIALLKTCNQHCLYLTVLDATREKTMGRWNFKQWKLKHSLLFFLGLVINPALGSFNYGSVSLHLAVC